MSLILEGCDGVVCQTDDILVYGSDEEQHDRRLHAVMEKLQQSGVTAVWSHVKYGEVRVLKTRSEVRRACDHCQRYLPRSR